MARAERGAGSEIAEGCRRHTEWSKLAGWLRWGGLLPRPGASWCPGGAGLVAAGACLVLGGKGRRRDLMEIAPP